VKKVVAVLTILTLFLSGCRAEPQWETVSDEVPAQPVTAQEPCVIQFGVPSDAEKQFQTESRDRSVYVQENGDYEIVSDVITAGSLDDAVRQVSGFSPDDLELVQTTRFGLPEVQFAWSSESDEGGYVSRASLVEDGDYYYALIFSVREGLGDKYRDCAQAVFSSFGLYGDEQF